jgi:putative selenate reductase
MHPEPLARLLERILIERAQSGSILDLPIDAFFVPPFASSQFAVLSETCSLPIGPAAGPHTHLAQSILSGWLSGGRVFELKTVQILDELEIEKPCIDTADEGYNTEWSTELRIGEAIEEYTKAWILLHVISALEYGTADHGSVFTMSVGYDLHGITSERVDAFIDTLSGRAENPALGRLCEEARTTLSATHPPQTDAGADARRRATEALDSIPPVMCRSVALSTMHGCPPEEIEAIALHLIEKKQLDTVVKLNPTLLGLDHVQRILAENGYGYGLDAEAFARDLQYPRALELIALLRIRAAGAGRTFGVKLSNTLPVTNERSRLPCDTEYLSGKALLPITVALAARLLGDLEVPLPVSYSAGATAGNIEELLGCGLAPVTVSTDLLKPGGYGRLGAVARAASGALAAGAEGASSPTRLMPSADRLAALAAAVSGRYDMRVRRGATTARVGGALPVIDCFVAPCVEACPISQDVPGYMRAAATGAPDEALRCVAETNPFPALTAALCDQRCAKACTRIEYEGPVQIRKIKGVAVRRAEEARATDAIRRDVESTGAPATAGPSVLAEEPGVQGMSAAYFYARAGHPVTVSDPRAAVAARIASELAAYRIAEDAVNADLARIEATGVRFAGVDTVRDTVAGAGANAGADTIVVRQPVPDPRPSIIELIAAGKQMAPDVPDTERESRRKKTSAEHADEIRLKAGRRIGPARGTDEEVAQVEFARCLECDAVCLKCVQVCPNRANVAVEMRRDDGLRDPYQVVHLDAWCNDCGNCETFCPYPARPHREKLTIFPSVERFEFSEAPGFVPAGEELLVRTRLGGTGQCRRQDDLTRRPLIDDPDGSIAVLVSRILTDYSYLLPRGS